MQLGDYMFSKYKGEFKYLKKQPVRIGLLTLVLLLMCAGVFMIGYINKGDVKNIFTIIAVLGMLPVAKMIVSFIMVSISFISLVSTISIDHQYRPSTRKTLGN